MTEQRTAKETDRLWFYIEVLAKESKQHKEQLERIEKCLINYEDILNEVHEQSMKIENIEEKLNSLDKTLADYFIPKKSRGRKE